MNSNICCESDNTKFSPKVMLEKLTAHGYNCIIVLGPTAVGKTALAVQLTDYFNGELISADSRQVYRGLDIGSGKDLCEFTLENPIRTIPYHMIDITDLNTEFSVFDYQKSVYNIFPEILSRGRIPIFCGGTGMYLDSIVRGYDLVEVPCNQELRKELSGKSDSELIEYLLKLKNGNIHNKTDIEERHRLLRAIEIEVFTQSKRNALEKCSTQEKYSTQAKHNAHNVQEEFNEQTTHYVEGEQTTQNMQPNSQQNLHMDLQPTKEEQASSMPKRPDIHPLIIGTTFQRDILRSGIKRRLIARFSEGMIDEVKSLHEQGFSWERLERLGLEYRFIAEYLQGKIENEQKLQDSLYIAIGQFAKRQETWFRRMEKQGTIINWLPFDNSPESLTVIYRFNKTLELINKL